MNAKIKLILSMVIFGTIGLFVKNIPLSSGAVAMTRGFIGALFLLIFAIVKKQSISWKDIKNNIVLLAVTGGFIGVNWILLFEAYKYTTVANATLCYYLEPIFLILASAVIYKEKISPVKGICVLTALLGMCFVSGVFPYNSEAEIEFTGVFLGVGAAIFYALVILINRKVKNIASYDMTMVQLFFAALVTLPYVMVTEDLSAVSLDIKASVLLLIMGVVHTGISYVLYFSSVRDLSAQSTAVLSYVDPMVAIVLSMTVLGEDMTVYGVLGAVLILGSTLISELKK